VHTAATAAAGKPPCDCDGLILEFRSCEQSSGQHTGQHRGDDAEQGACCSSAHPNHVCQQKLDDVTQKQRQLSTAYTLGTAQLLPCLRGCCWILRCEAHACPCCCGC
jgi:hypothetical protein